MPAIITIDARGLRCPLPVLKSEKQLEKMSIGDTLNLMADDPIARIDIPIMCKRLGLLCELKIADDIQHFTIKK
jgi:tRNA 2-thiouridine synthesizing protein A